MSEPAILKPLEEIPGVYVARKASLRCTAFVLKDGGVCLWSPLNGMAAQIAQDLTGIGPVKFLLAPNHYHNKALIEYYELFSEARLCAPERAHARLNKVTGLDFEGLGTLGSALPEHLSILEPEGLKNGEIWIKSALQKRISWFVVDALSGEKMSAKKDRGEDVVMMKTFPNFGIDDAKIYSAWVLRQLAKDKPALVVPCHGAIIANDQLSGSIEEILINL
ncbi:MAG: hypothetical protein AAF512_07095 [Pseudomonadota bacterium]